MKFAFLKMMKLSMWFVPIVIFSGGLICYLNGIGVMEANQNDETLHYFHDSVRISSKVPHLKQFAEISNSLISSNRKQEITVIDTIINEYFEDSRLNSTLSHSDANSSHKKKPFIPQIIHQTWDSYSVPRTFVENIYSWVDLHPDWEYWFWTTKAVQCFLEKHYNQYMYMYSKYSNNVSKADAMRYFVLHKYGGVYVDLDTKCIKPLDVWTNYFCCVLSEEPYEHSFIVRKEKSSSIANSPMACKSNHNLFQTAIKLLPEYAKKFPKDYIKSTGPLFLVSALKKFQYSLQNFNTKSCPVTIAPPKYFLPRFDASQSEVIDGTCSIPFYKFLPEVQRELCLNLIDRNYKNLVTKAAFMDHNWLHVSVLGSKWKKSNNVHFFSILPKAKNLETIFCNNL